MNSQHLLGKKALVTGSIQGIGLAIAQALGSAGASVGIHGIGSSDSIETATREVLASGAPEVRFFGGDLRNPGEINQLISMVETWGGPDILVNNAGIQQTMPFAEVTDDLWQDIIAVNLSAPFYTMRRTLPRMAERGFGRVINIASVHGLVASRAKAPYVASKHGLVGLSRAVALEYAAAGHPDLGGVTVNCICPGWTETPLIEPQVQERAATHGGDRAAGVADLLREKQPSLRMSTTAEVGSLALWLTLPIAHNVTGTATPIDGGWTVQ